MAINLPIVSEWNPAGINKAINDFKKLETNGQKAAFAIKKAAVPAGIAIALLGAAAFDAVKAFAEDDAAAQKLGTTLKNVTSATDAQVSAVEAFITKTSIAAAVTDDELRPALDKLVRGTGDVTKAQELLGLALDISAGTGKDLGAVSDALSKAFNGNLGPLKKLDPALASLIENGATADEVFAALSKTFSGQASTAANTTQGKMKSLSIQMSEFKESVGAAVAPLMEKLLPALTAIGNFVRDNTGLVVGFGAAFAALAITVLAVNGAMKAYAAIQAIVNLATIALTASTYALWIATGVGIIVAIIGALVTLQLKFNILGMAVDGLKAGFNFLWGVVKTVFNWIRDNWQLLVAIITGPFGLATLAVVKFKDDIMNFFGLIYNGIKTTMGFVADVITAPFKFAFRTVAKLWNDTVGKLSFTVPSWVPLIGGKGFDVPDIPMLANGGIIMSPTLAMIGEKGPEAVIPLSRAGGMGMGGANITVNVNGGDPNQILRVLQQYVRQSGPLPINTRAM